MKTKEDEILKIILSEFPGQESKISSRYFISSSFLESCEDYVICLRSIKKLEIKKEKDIDKELEELKGLLAELREEILSKIGI